MRRSIIEYGLIVMLLVGSVGCAIAQETKQNIAWELVWSDEFETPGAPAPAKWLHEKKGARWVNNEKQRYVEDLKNARVEDGKLIIEARLDDKVYTSARLKTQIKAEWKYGRFEVHAKLPKGRGTWPAIWMMPTFAPAWPVGGEIDIMEHVGYDPGQIHASVHCKKYNWPKGNQKTAITTVTDFGEAFHTYTLEWFPDRLDFFVDDQKYLTYENEQTGKDAWPFDNKFYLILNVAIGGNWGGQQGIDDAMFPVWMEVEYVRVYQTDLEQLGYAQKSEFSTVK